MSKVNTLQVGDKLLVLNGVDPLRYVDLSKNKVYQYKITKSARFIDKLKSKVFRNA